VGLLDKSAGDILAALAGSAPVREALAADAARRVAERETLRKRLVELDKESGKRWPALVKAQESAQAERDRAIRALSDAQAALNLAVVARASYSAEVQRERERIEARLRAGASDDVIDAFAGWLLDEQSTTAKAIMPPHRSQTEDPKTHVVTISWTTNWRSIHARLDALRAAYADVDRLRLIANQESVLAEIEITKAGLPRIAEETEQRIQPKQPDRAGQFGIIKLEEEA